MEAVPARANGRKRRGRVIMRGATKDLRAYPGGPAAPFPRASGHGFGGCAAAAW
jgi:hypothetical protein